MTRNLLAALALLVAAVPGGAHAAESYDNCVGYIDTLPATVSTQGVWCLRKDLATGIASGSAITVGGNNITIDCNGFKLGGLSAGPGTQATGIYANSRQNIRVRRCGIRGFSTGIDLFHGAGHVVESNRLDGNTVYGINMTAETGAIRRNLIVDTVGGTAFIGWRRYGIRADGRIDILDNTVSGVTPPAALDNGATGIWLSNGFANGNRVSGVVSALGSEGINSQATFGGVVADNVITSVGVWGIRCNDTTTVARNNTISGAATGVGFCTNGGGNVHHP